MHGKIKLKLDNENYRMKSDSRMKTIRTKTIQSESIRTKSIPMKSMESIQKQKA